MEMETWYCGDGCNLYGGIGCFFVTLQLSNGSMAEWSGSRTCDQQVVVSNPGHRAAECNSGQVVYTHVSLSPSSIIWYQPMVGDALQL